MMKSLIALVVGLVVTCSAQGQNPRPGGIMMQDPPPELPKFDLNFPGGKPEQLIERINDALKDSPVNVIIPTEYDNIQIPPMKLKNVNVQQVFEALGRASQKSVNYPTGFQAYGPPLQFPGQTIQSFTTSYMFQATPPIQTNSVWYFVVQKPPQTEEQTVCRFYQLGPYLEQGLNINDITTAIKAGYKMLGEPAPPELNFHKETQLLIAVGPSSKLKLIDEALSQLTKAKAPAAEKTEKPKS
jgi:hypothetical protein